jgi:hypothetical protein
VERKREPVCPPLVGGLGVVTRTCACTPYKGVCGTCQGGFVFAPYRFVLNSVTSHIIMVILLLPQEQCDGPMVMKHPGRGPRGVCVSVSVSLLVSLSHTLTTHTHTTTTTTAQPTHLLIVKAPLNPSPSRPLSPELLSFLLHTTTH